MAAAGLLGPDLVHANVIHRLKVSFPPEQAVPCKYKRRQTKTTYGLRLYLARISL